MTDGPPLRNCVNANKTIKPLTEPFIAIRTTNSCNTIAIKFHQNAIKKIYRADNRGQRKLGKPRRDDQSMRTGRDAQPIREIAPSF